MRISLIVAMFIVLWTTVVAVVVAFSGEVKAGQVNKCVYPGRVVYTDRECQVGVLTSEEVKTPKPLVIAKSWPYWQPTQNYVEYYPTYRYINGSSYRDTDVRYYRDSCNSCYSLGYNSSYSHLRHRRFNKLVKPARLIPAKPTYHRLKPR